MTLTWETCGGGALVTALFRSMTFGRITNDRQDEMLLRVAGPNADLMRPRTLFEPAPNGVLRSVALTAHFVTVSGGHLEPSLLGNGVDR